MHYRLPIKHQITTSLHFLVIYSKILFYIRIIITPNCLFLFVASREDYLFAGFPVSLSADNTTICFSAGILEDDEVEDTEDFMLVLTSDLNSMVVIMEGETTVFIADNGEDSI